MLLMERRGDNTAWDNYLQAAFEANKTWDQLVREILFPDEKDPQRAGAGFFYTKRLEAYGQNPIDHPGLTRDVGRLFLGIDLQCAQCHDHLFIGDYKQREFQGLYSVYLNVTAKGDQPVPAVIEKPLIKKHEFVSVFDSTKQETGPRIPFGVELPIPEAPAAGTPPASALALIARDLPRVDNDRFSRNIANRLWFLMIGRGLVHPLDLHHSDNPPSHPELLDLLAREFATHQFDIRWMLRELALSQTYQRSSQGDAIPEPPPPESYLWGIEKRLSAEQLLRSTLRATGDLERLEPPPGTAAAGEWKELRTRFLTAYANEPREPEGEYLATVKGALFALNDGKLLDLMKRRPGNLLDRVATLTAPTEIADEFYLTIFTRFPTDEERGEVQAIFEKDPARREQSLATLAWAMLASIEFGINH
ncbi:MAG: DUF1553 domain-containing protein [Planctomycetota bacterium]|nr:DUF1553 domain-containing protein [Planctomycetota bacterium]